MNHNAGVTDLEVAEELEGEHELGQPEVEPQPRDVRVLLDGLRGRGGGWGQTTHPPSFDQRPRMSMECSVRATWGGPKVRCRLLSKLGMGGPARRVK